MSIEVAIWRIDEGLHPVSLDGMDYEQRLQRAGRGAVSASSSARLEPSTGRRPGRFQSIVRPESRRSVSPSGWRTGWRTRQVCPGSREPRGRQALRGTEWRQSAVPVVSAWVGRRPELRLLGWTADTPERRSRHRLGRGAAGECQGRSNLRPRGVDGQRKCPAKWPAKKSQDCAGGAGVRDGGDMVGLRPTGGASEGTQARTAVDAAGPVGWAGQRG